MRRRILTFSLFEAGQAAAAPGLTQEQEEFLNKYTKGSWKYDPTTGLVDVEGDFVCDGRGLKSLRGVKFGKVSWKFNCSSNKITSLEGAPQKVGGDFSCSNNTLTSLKGAPQKVGGGFHCDSNKITSLEGAPQEVGGGFHCDSNKITSLEGAPQEVGGDFYCGYNQLTTLEGAPQKIGGYFDCTSNKLTSLKGAPQKVGGYFKCSSNDLTSLEGAPQKVGGYFNCGFFQLPRGKWNIKGWLAVLEDDRLNAQSLILPFISPEAINKEIQKDPAGMIMKLKPFWNDERFKETISKLVWPEGYEEEMDIVGGLNTIGF